MRLKIISGAQSGVDQAALNAAIKYNINYAGYMPASGAENKSVNELRKLYPNLLVTKSYNNDIRTILNVQTSDILLNILPYWMSDSPGTNLGMDMGLELNKPYYNLRHFTSLEIFNILKWIKVNKLDYLKIGIGGPRESQCDDCYDLTFNFLDKLFKEIADWRENGD